MIATKRYEILVTEQETVRLLKEGINLDMTFGIGWCKLIWKKDEEMPRAIQRLMELRGVDTEGREGEGI